jgi:hypothetical protein
MVPCNEDETPRPSRPIGRAGGTERIELEEGLQDDLILHHGYSPCLNEGEVCQMGIIQDSIWFALGGTTDSYSVS